MSWVEMRSISFFISHLISSDFFFHFLFPQFFKYLGTPEYFLPKKFELRNHKGEVVQDLLADLIKEGTIDVKEMIRRKKLAKMLKDEEMGLAVATQAQQKTSTSKKEGGLIQVNMLDIAKEQKLGSRNG